MIESQKIKFKNKFMQFTLELAFYKSFFQNHSQEILGIKIHL